jgi:hypothetical protein
MEISGRDPTDYPFFIVAAVIIVLLAIKVRLPQASKIATLSFFYLKIFNKH